MKIAYNSMSIDDIGDVFEISKLCFSSPWSEASILNELNNSLANYIVARDVTTEKVIGFVGIWIIAGEGDITNIAVLPDYRHIGIGTNLLTQLFNTCYKLNCNIINLEVRSSNIPAQKLYESFSFKKIAVRKNYYSDNKEDAIIMQFTK